MWASELLQSKHPELPLVPKVNGCPLTYWPSQRDGRTRRAKSFAKTPSWVLNTSACLSFPLCRGELHSVNLSLPASLRFTLACRRTEDEKMGSKRRDWIKEREEKGTEKARWAPSQSIYQTQCGPPLPSPLLSCPKPPCNSVMIFIII